MDFELFQLESNDIEKDEFWSENSSEIRSLLEAGTVVGFDNLFVKSDLVEFKELLAEYSTKNPAKNHGLALQDIGSGENFYRIDDDPSKSAAPHIYLTYIFGDLDALETDFRELARNIFTRMLKIQNLLAGTAAEFGELYRNEFRLRPQIIRYPRGGGFLEGHVHNYEPQRYGLILNLSQPGVDYERGGTYFDAPNGRVEGPEVGRFARLIVFKYDIFHGINPIDVGDEIDWSSNDGKISAVLPLY